MKLNTFMAIVAVMAGLFGLGFVFIPEQVLSFYGAAPDAGVNYMAQLLGAALLGFAVILWLCKDAEDSPVLQAILLGLFVAEGVGFVVALIMIDQILKSPPRKLLHQLSKDRCSRIH